MLFQLKLDFFARVQKKAVWWLLKIHNIKKLENLSKQFGITPVFAAIICIAGNKTIHLFMVPISKIHNILPKVKNGYSLRFGKKRIGELLQNGNVDYSSWENEEIGAKDFA